MTSVRNPQLTVMTYVFICSIENMRANEIAHMFRLAKNARAINERSPGAAQAHLPKKVVQPNIPGI